MAFIKFLEGTLSLVYNSVYNGASLASEFFYEVYKGGAFVINDMIKAVGG